MISRLWNGFALLVGVAVISGCTSVHSVTSESAPSPPVIDGSLEDWSGSLKRYEDGSILMGVRHDRDYLYVAVSTSDRSKVQQVVMTGLELWVDAAGGKKERIGFRFPMGLIHYNRGSSNALPLPMGGVDQQTVQRLFAATTRELEILEENMPPRRVGSGVVPHLTAKATLEFGTLTYEMSIPLGASKDLNLGSVGDVVGLGLKTSELQGPPAGMRDEGRRPERGPGGGDLTGRRTSERGRAPGGSRGARDADTLDLWLKVALAR